MQMLYGCDMVVFVETNNARALLAASRLNPNVSAAQPQYKLCFSKIEKSCYHCILLTLLPSPSGLAHQETVQTQTLMQSCLISCWFSANSNSFRG